MTRVRWVRPSGSTSTYAKSRAEGLGLRCDVGLIERPERMLISLIAVGVSGLGVPYILNVGLWAFRSRQPPSLSGGGYTGCAEAAKG